MAKFICKFDKKKKHLFDAIALVVQGQDGTFAVLAYEGFDADEVHHLPWADRIPGGPLANAENKWSVVVVGFIRECYKAPLVSIDEDTYDLVPGKTFSLPRGVLTSISKQWVRIGETE